MNLNEKKQQALRELSREAIYESVAQLIKEVGLDSITMNKIAKKSGMATGSLYNYFKNKEDVIEFVLQRFFELFFKEIEKVISVGTASERLKALIRCCFEYGEINEVLFVSLNPVQKVARIHDSSSELNREIDTIKKISDIVSRGIATGEFRTVDCGDAAKVIFALILGACESCVFWETMDVDRETELLYSFSFAYLRKDNDVSD